MDPQVSTDVAEAAALAAAGVPVVLVVGPDAVVDLPSAGPVALLCGDPADPSVLAAAAEMARDVFGN